MSLHWVRAALAALTGLLGTGLLFVAAVPVFSGHLGIAALPLLLGLTLTASAVYSYYITRCWLDVESPPLAPYQLALAHVAPAIGLLCGGFLLLIVALIVMLVPALRLR